MHACFWQIASSYVASLRSSHILYHILSIVASCTSSIIPYTESASHHHTNPPSSHLTNPLHPRVTKHFFRVVADTHKFAKQVQLSESGRPLIHSGTIAQRERQDKALIHSLLAQLDSPITARDSPLPPPRLRTVPATSSTDEVAPQEL
jgi:hypothetical protein